MSLVRVRYFTGQLLGVDDLRTEQEYVRERHRRHNRWLHGAGVATGLEVTPTVDDSGAWSVTIAPGFAIDPNGEEIVVDDVQVQPLAGVHAPDCFVVLCYTEVAQSPVPTRIGASADPEASRIVETFALSLVREPLPPASVALARLVRGNDGWALDTGLAPMRTR